MESTHNISSSEKLPSILMLNNNSSYYDYNHVVVSPPLTPAVSPSTTMMIDSNNLYNNYAYSNYNSTTNSINSPISSHDGNQTTTHKHICHFNFCGWSFKRYEHLKRHMLVHTGERPHTCRYPGCGKSFSRSDNFHAHYRTHTKKKNCTTTHTKKKNAVVTTVSAAVTGGVTSTQNDSSSSFSVANQTDQKFMTFNNSIASSVATTAAAVAVSQQQMQPNQQVFYNSHLYDGNSPEINNYYNRNSFNNTPSVMNFNLPQQNHHMISPSSSPSTPPRTLSLLNHESPSFFSSPIYANSYMSNSYPIYQPPTINNMPKLPIKSNTSTKSTNKTPKSSITMKSHACPVTQCMRRFKRLEHLKRHMRIHTLERPFRCSYPGCQKNFSRSDNLSQHIKTHQRHQEKRSYV